jgi:hypothetical protein
MKLKCKIIGALFATVANMSLVAPVRAGDAVSTDWAKVVSLQAGWTVDRMLVFHGAQMKNPEGCSLTTNGYIIDESAPGHNTFYTLLLSAILNTRDVSLVIQGCFENRPRIVSVAIR